MDSQADLFFPRLDSPFRAGPHVPFCAPISSFLPICPHGPSLLPEYHVRCTLRLRPSDRPAEPLRPVSSSHADLFLTPLDSPFRAGPHVPFCAPISSFLPICPHGPSLLPNPPASAHELRNE